MLLRIAKQKMCTDATILTKLYCNTICSWVIFWQWKKVGRQTIMKAKGGKLHNPKIIQDVLHDVWRLSLSSRIEATISSVVVDMGFFFWYSFNVAKSEGIFWINSIVLNCSGFVIFDISPNAALIVSLPQCKYMRIILNMW